jgi:hypothetical protein
VVTFLRRFHVAVCALPVLLWYSSEVEGQFVIVAKNGDALADGSGTTSAYPLGGFGYGAPGEAIYYGGGRESSGAIFNALLRAGPTPSTVRRIVSPGDPVPNGNGNFGLGSSLHDMLTNRQGSVAFDTELTNTLGGSSDDEAIFAGGVNGSPLVQIVRKGQLIPGGAGERFDDFALADFNQLGQVAFFGVPSTLVSNSVWRASADGALTRISPASMQASSNAPRMNDSGRVSFYRTNPSELHSGTSSSALSLIAAVGGAAPSGNGIINNLTNYEISPMNSTGKVAFGAKLSNTIGGAADDQAILLGDGQTLVELVRKGQLTPGGNGLFLSPAGSDKFLLNDAGQVVFSTSLTGFSGGSNFGIFRADSTAITEIVREGSPAPGGGTFALFGGGLGEALCIGPGGEVIFRASVVIGINTISGYFLYANGAISRIVVSGDVIPGVGPIATATPTNGTLCQSDGQLVFQFSAAQPVANGIAVWTEGFKLLTDGFE